MGLVVPWLVEMDAAWFIQLIVYVLLSGFCLVLWFDQCIHIWGILYTCFSYISSHRYSLWCHSNCIFDVVGVACNLSSPLSDCKIKNTSLNVMLIFPIISQELFIFSS